MKMICPHCGVNGSANDSLLGREVKCPKCLGFFKVTSEIVKPIPIEAIELEQVDEPPVTDLTSQGVTDNIDENFDDIFGEEELVSARIVDEEGVHAGEELEIAEEESEFDEGESELLKLLNQEFVDELDEESDEEPVAALSDVGQQDGEDLGEWGDGGSALSDFSDDDLAEQGVSDETESDEDDDTTLTIIEDFPSDTEQLDSSEETESEIVLEEADIFNDTDDDWEIAKEVAGDPDQTVEPDEEGIEEWNLTEEIAEESAPVVETDDEDVEEWNLTAEVAEESDPAVDSDDDEDVEEWNLTAEVAEESDPAVDSDDDEDVEEWNLTAEVAEESDPVIDSDDDEDVEEWNLTAEVTEESDPVVETVDEEAEEWNLAAEVDNFDNNKKEEAESPVEVGKLFRSDDTELSAEEESSEEEQLIQKCSACGEYVDSSSKHENGVNVYCDKCVPAKDLGDESDEVTAGVPVAAAAVSTGKFTIITLIKDSWSYCKGVKGSIWAALIVMYLVLLGLGAVSVFVMPGLQNSVAGLNPLFVDVGVQVVAFFLSYIFTAGILLIAVKKVGGQPYSWKMVFSGFGMIGTLVLAIILQVILLTIGFCLFILPGIYLGVGYMLTFPLIMEKGLSPWQAMEASRKAIHKRWWTVFFTFIGMSILSALSAIPLGIGLIWTVPMFFVLVGILYYHFFGDDE